MYQETIGYSLMKYHMHTQYFTVSRKLKNLNEYYILAHLFHLYLYGWPTTNHSELLTLLEYNH